MKKIIYLFATMMLITLQTFSQSPNWLWAKSMGGSNRDVGISITTDASGNVYTAGYFSGTVDFDPGSGIYNLTSAGDATFIYKLDNSGNFIWAKALVGSTSYGNSIILDAQGNVYITGNFSGLPLDMDPDSSGTYYFNSFGSWDSFVLKLDNSGSFIWAKQIGGPGNDGGFSIAVDPAGNVYTTGYFFNSADFDPDTSSTFNIASSGGLDIYVSRLNSSGNFVWAKAMGGINDDVSHCIALDPSGDIYLTGSFMATADFDPGPSVLNLTSAGNSDIYIVKLDSSGNLVFAKQMGGSLIDNGNSLALGNGNIYITGAFRGVADLDPDSTGILNVTCAGGSDIFISKLDNNTGNLKWVKRIGASNWDSGSSLTLNQSGNENVYITGNFRDVVDFDPDSSTTFNLSAVVLDDIFICKLDSSGTFVWAKSAGGTSNDGAFCLTVDASQNVFITGGFASASITFGTSACLNTNSSGNAADLFIAKLDNAVTGMESFEHNNKISISPNPSPGNFTITFPNAINNGDVQIFNAYGEKIFTQNIHHTSSTEIHLKHIPGGIYFVKVWNGEKYFSNKIIIQQNFMH